MTEREWSVEEIIESSRQWDSAFYSDAETKWLLSKAADALSVQQWIPCKERLPEEYGEYRITWTTSASKKRFVGDAEYEVTDELDDKRNDFKGEWLLDDYIKAYSDVNIIAWKPIEEPWKEDVVGRLR